MHYLKNAKDSEDACVDIYLELKAKLLTHEIRNFPGWLYRVCQNHCLKKLRKKSKVIFEELNFSHEKVESETSGDHYDRFLELLPSCIDELSEDQRQCIVLFYLHGKSYKEIEEMKGFDFKKIKSSIQHGKKQLKKKLQSDVRKSIS